MTMQPNLSKTRGQSRRDHWLERRIFYCEAETARLGANWKVKLGVWLARSNYETYCDRGHCDWRYEAWRLVQIVADLLSEIESRNS